MIYRHLIWVGLILIGSFLVFMACSKEKKRAEKELTEARAKVESLREAGINKSAPELYNTATTKLGTAEMNMGMNDYEDAIKYAREAIADAEQAKNQAKSE